MYQLKQWLKLMFVYPPLRMAVEDYDSYWRDKRGADIGELSDWQKERADYVVRILQNEGSVSICDIACGDGSILNYISERISAKKLIGTDISQFALAKAKEFGINTVTLDIAKISEVDNIPHAEYQLLFEILEHVPHSERLLEGAYLKADKGVFFSFPNTGFFAHRLRLFFGKFPLQWRLFPGEHVRYWTKSDLYWWLKSLRYKDFQVHYYKGVPVLNKLMPSWFAAAFVVFLPKNASKGI